MKDGKSDGNKDGLSHLDQPARSKRKPRVPARLSPILSRAALRHHPHEKEEYRCILCVFCACPSRGSELNTGTRNTLITSAAA